SVNQNNGDNTGGSNKSPGSQQTAGQGFAGAGRQVDPTAEFNDGARSINARWQRSLSRTPASVVVTDAVKAFEEVITQNKKQLDQADVQFKIEQIDSSYPGVKIGTVLVCGHIKIDDRAIMMVYAIMLQGSVGDLGVQDLTKR